MPFNSKVYSFNPLTLGAGNEVGALYGLFMPTPGQPGFYTCRYVGQTNNLRTRLYEHYNNPPIAGVTHFFAEVIGTELQRRLRERQLDSEPFFRACRQRPAEYQQNLSSSALWPPLPCPTISNGCEPFPSSSNSGR